MTKEKIYIMGDSRFDQILNRKNKNTQIPYLKNILSQSFNIIFGSYDSQDEKIITNSLLKYYPNGSNSLQNFNHKIILVPHEINNQKIKNMISKLEKNNFKPYLFSDLNNNKNESIDLLIVNKVGILADIYRYTQLAYVGSGFSDGVHSVIEPGVYGNVVSFGPNIELLDEAKYLHKHKIGYMVQNSDNMLNFFNLHKNHEAVKILSRDIKDYIYKQQGSSDRILQFIRAHL